MYGGQALPGGVMFTDGRRCVLAHLGVEDPTLVIHSFPATRLKGPRFLRILGQFWDALRAAFWVWRREMKGATRLELAITLGLILLQTGALFWLLGRVRSSVEFPVVSLLLLPLLLFGVYRLLAWVVPGRLLQKHAAEHRVGYLLERGLPLTLENAQQMSSFHPRCGLNLVGLSVLAGALLAFVLPAWAAIALGFILAAEALPRWPVLGWLAWPFQALTLARPGEEDLQVALAAAQALQNENPPTEPAGVGGGSRGGFSERTLKPPLSPFLRCLP